MEGFVHKEPIGRVLKGQNPRCKVPGNLSPHAIPAFMENDAAFPLGKTQAYLDISRHLDPPTPILSIKDCL